MQQFSWTLWQSVKHQFFDCLVLVGLRDRLRCPRCKAVGTWKPHGGWYCAYTAWRYGTADVTRWGAIFATNRRWLCKYCGFNLSTEGEFQCYPDKVKKVWSTECENSTSTPRQRVGYKIWPWRG